MQSSPQEREVVKRPITRAHLLEALVLLLLSLSATGAGEPLRVSVYCTAGDVHRDLTNREARERVLRTLEPLRVSHIFLEGRRGDEYVSNEQLAETRDYFEQKHIHCSGGIATVPGGTFGTRQNMELGWLNWENSKTQSDVAGFFAKSAAQFDELIVDDFFCTADTSQESINAKGSRNWGEYRRELMVSLIKPIILDPARTVRSKEKLIIKFPQWYDRFQVFGYDPPRMAAQFNQVWVGTEVRDPTTRRMGFVQPTEGYMNFRWLSSQAGDKVRGAWFDHIECSAQNFLDQAYQSVLAGARELTLFHLGDLMDGHPGDAALSLRMPDLMALAARVHGKQRSGIAFYKPPGSDGDENLYLADYLGMLGMPLLPEANYPEKSSVAFLPVQAAADPMLLGKMERHLNQGATLVLTPALVRALGEKGANLAGIRTGPVSALSLADSAEISGNRVALAPPLEIDAALTADSSEVRIAVISAGHKIPLLTRKPERKGEILVLNVMTFSDKDFGKGGEWLLAPRQLGLPKIPQSLADAIRSSILPALGIRFHAPPGIALVAFEKEVCIYSFLNEQVRFQLQENNLDLPAHQLFWRKKRN